MHTKANKKIRIKKKLKEKTPIKINKTINLYTKANKKIRIKKELKEKTPIKIN